MDEVTRLRRRVATLEIERETLIEWVTELCDRLSRVQEPDDAENARIPRRLARRFDS